MARNEHCCRKLVDRRAEGIQVCSLAENRSSADQSEEGCTYSIFEGRVTIVKGGVVRSGGLENYIPFQNYSDIQTLVFVTV